MPAMTVSASPCLAWSFTHCPETPCTSETLAFVRKHATEARKTPLCGNSIGTDRRFLAAYMPELEEYLHYRSIDVSTIKELARRWYPEAYSAAPKKAGAHRALDDIKESVEELKYWRKAVFRERSSTSSP